MSAWGQSGRSGPVRTRGEVYRLRSRRSGESNLLVRIAILSNKESPTSKPSREFQPTAAQANFRPRAVIDTARQLGLLDGENGRIGGRVRRDLVTAAKEKSGIASD